MMPQIGSQTPRLCVVPPCETRAAADDVIEMADIAGLTLDPWQEFVARQGLGESGGKWTAFESVLVVPRRNGKSALLQAMILAALYVWGERSVIYSAHRFDTAQETFAELRALIESSDELAGEVRKIYTANGKEAIILRNGCRVKFMSRAKGAGRGFSGDRIIFDEAYDLSPQVLGAMVPTLAARSMEPGSNPQIWYASSAAMATSKVLHSLRRRAMGPDPGRLFYADWSCTDDVASNDVDAWYEANPALGIRIAEDFIRDEMTALMHSPGEFRRERLGIWDPEPEEAAADLPVSLEDWGACSVKDPLSIPARLVGKRVIGIGVSMLGKSASIGSVGKLDDGKAFAQALQVAPGASWVADSLSAHLAAAGGRVAAVAMPGSGPALSILPEVERVCKKHKVDLELLSGKRYSSACEAFVRSVSDDLVCHAGQVWLSTAIGGARKNEHGETWEWDLEAATADVSPLVAITVGLRVLDEVRIKRPTRVGAF